MNIKRTLKELVPLHVLDVYTKLKYSKADSRYAGMDAGDVFAKIYKENLWRSIESVSGPGSAVHNTFEVVLGINSLIRELRIQSILDAPCGDFNWMKGIELRNIQYTGVDIVRELIAGNIIKYGGGSVRFVVMDICKDQMPIADLVLSRDCLVHFSYDHIHQALKNVIASGSTYFATTSFAYHKVNFDITTGDWRPLNLQIDPFRFPPPWRYVPEHNAGLSKKEHRGKMLGLWKIKDLSLHLSSNGYKLK